MACVLAGGVIQTERRGEQVNAWRGLNYNATLENLDLTTETKASNYSMPGRGGVDSEEDLESRTRESGSMRDRWERGLDGLGRAGEREDRIGEGRNEDLGGISCSSPHQGGGSPGGGCPEPGRARKCQLPQPPRESLRCGPGRISTPRRGRWPCEASPAVQFQRETPGGHP